MTGAALNGANLHDADLTGRDLAQDQMSERVRTAQLSVHVIGSVSMRAAALPGPWRGSRFAP